MTENEIIKAMQSENLETLEPYDVDFMHPFFSGSYTSGLVTGAKWMQARIKRKRFIRRLRRIFGRKHDVRLSDPVKLADAPVGLFFYGGKLCLKTSFIKYHGPVCIVCDTGEYFWGGKDSAEERDLLLVNPVIVEYYKNIK